jgi:hypothetical protein
VIIYEFDRFLPFRLPRLTAASIVLLIARVAPISVGVRIGNNSPRVQVGGKSLYYVSLFAPVLAPYPSLKWVFIPE